jgi:superfamily II DNA or RNA helicase
LSKTWSSLQFVFPWRSYQAQLLKHFDTHISDQHFHVIAPPGSGKTILGIEIMRRLGTKTLVLAPTLTIRNQWEDRLQSFFTKNKDFKSYSFDVKAPSIVTFITYQSLHAFYKSFEDKADYLDFFKKHNIETLVLDEAHHLKNAWWTCLVELKNSRPFFVVALTATPPYDSDRKEVAKYFNLCGEIDDEIAVPDLVKETDLCPHQDFVYFSKPEDLEVNLIYEYRQKIADFKDDLLADNTFITFVKQHRFYRNTEKHLDEIYSNTEYFSALLIFLNACGTPIESSKLRTLGFNKNETINFPELYLDWLEVLFQNLLVKDREQLEESEPYLSSLEKKLRQLHVFDKKRVNFLGEDLLFKSLTNSPSKLKSIIKIVAAESKSLQANLRCVILTDYIRKAFLTTPEQQLQDINKIGVIPIFQYLRCRFENKKDLAVLTGSLVIIHTSIIDAFNNLTEDVFTYSPLDVDANFVVVSGNTTAKHSIVSTVTQLFENGTIKVLVGTKSLLGEGWDAPSINSLILASFIGSFVSSNQMRGRAIRKNPKRPDKTGNIWHLACVDITAQNGGKDIETLRRRFEAFVGVTTNTIPFISNGIDRLDIPEHFTDVDIDQLNTKTVNSATNRVSIAKKWKDSIGNGTALSKQIQVFDLNELPFKKQKQVYYFDIVRFFTIELFFSILLFYFEYIIKAFNLILQRGFTYFIYSFLAYFLISFGRKLYKAITLYMRYGSLYKTIQKMGRVILDSLSDLGHLTTSKDQLTVVAARAGSRDVICNLIGASTYENAIFASALSQLLDPIDSPRYLIIKTSFFRRRLNIENFYPVPELFGDKKKHALVFQNNWKKHIGRNKLFYTRHFEGRQLLLKARLFHVYNAFRKTTKEVTIWK